MLQVLVQSYWTPKAGSSSDEYEDAFFPLISGIWNAPRVNFAIADGASEGILSGQWAQILVRTLCRLDGSHTELTTLLKRAQQSWHKWKSHYLQMRERQNRPVQWYEESGLERGAFATLLGLSLTVEDQTTTWNAVALGDSCLFQIRDSHLISAFPISKSSQMNSRPFLIASNPLYNATLPEHIYRMQGRCRSGDRLLMMTDALAHWCLREHEAGHPPWEALRPENSFQQNGFEHWVGLLRSENSLQNDDVTLIAIDLD